MFELLEKQEELALRRALRIRFPIYTGNFVNFTTCPPRHIRELTAQLNTEGNHAQKKLETMLTPFLSLLQSFIISH